MSDQVEQPVAPTREPRSETTLREKGAIVVSVLNALGMFGIVIVILSNGIPAENRELMSTVVGALIGGYLGSNNYWWGSSSGSAAKDRQKGG
jgi:hypothetical protein